MQTTGSPNNGFRNTRLPSFRFSIVRCEFFGCACPWHSSENCVKEEQTRLFLNHAFAWVTPAIFVIFVVFGSTVWGAKPLSSLGRMQIRHFRRFRQNGPFLAGDKNTVYQKHGLCHPECELKFLGCDLARNVKSIIWWQNQGKSCGRLFYLASKALEISGEF